MNNPEAEPRGIHKIKLMATKTHKLPAPPVIYLLDSLKHADIAMDFNYYVNDDETKLFFKNLFDNMPCAGIVAELQTQRYLYINQKAVEDLTGYSVKKIIKKGMPFFVSRLYPDDIDATIKDSLSVLLPSLHRGAIEKVEQCKISYSYHLKRKDNIWVQFLLEYIILEMDKKGFPLILLTSLLDGTATDKKDNAIIYSFSQYEKDNTNTNSLQTNVFKKTTAREDEVIRLISNGTNTKEIAEKMGLSPFTIRAHRRNIFKKTNTRNIAELTSYAYMYGIIKR